MEGDNEMLMEKFADMKMEVYQESKRELDRQTEYEDQVAEIRMEASPLHKLYNK